ncbi:MAG: alpha/beta hydrolase family esterase, partial [Burkholderiaceae bacterium]
MKILLLTALLAGCMQAGAQPRTTDHEAALASIAITHQGRERSALVYVPDSYSASKRAPLVLMFHGGGGNAPNAVRTAQMHAHADKHGLIVAYPAGTGRLENTLLTWNAWDCCGYAMQNEVDDVGFTRELIVALKSRYSIDANRIYATGLSNGGMMSYRLACELSDQIAAIAPVAGSLNTDSCTPREPV